MTTDEIIRDALANFHKMAYIVYKMLTDEEYRKVLETSENEEVKHLLYALHRWKNYPGKRVLLSNSPLKSLIILRDDSTCNYCKSKLERDEITFDHVIPKSLGGYSNYDNLVVSCWSCNQAKADIDLR